MNALRLFALSSLSIVMMNFSCDKQTELTPCEGTPTPVATQGLPIPTGCSLAALRGETKTYVVNSLADLATATQCSSGAWPAIDFTKYTLLAGRAPMSGGALLRTQVVELDCQGNYTHTVAIVDGPTLSPTDVDYAILVPKLPSTATVSFVVKKTQ
jgi:hypothetical protein